MSIEGASSTSSLTYWKYDVFISFRGEDTRKNFTDHLYDALKRKGINVFKDDKGLGKGKSIAPELSEAIEASRISVIVFSRNYASSTWCLDELVQIVKSMNENKQIVIPIFYDVLPSMVRNQTGSFQDAFVEHESKNREKVQNWRNALKMVANLSGFHLEDRHETIFIQNVVWEICKLIPSKLRTHGELVGINSRLETLMKLLTSTTKSYDVDMVGIYGMGGIGKTTIARAISELISHQFDGTSFLANVREISKGNNTLVHLQKQLLSQIIGETDINIWDECNGMDMIRRMLWHKKVLIVVDDVDDLQQLKILVGSRDWFGLGSRIIITTRDKHLLMTHGVYKLYEPEQLNHGEALELFSSKAFKNNKPSEQYQELSRQVLKYASGLPLALEVLGSFLFGRTLKEWESALERLRRDSEISILDRLQISFDGLQEKEKKIFLDIACFFKGKNKEHVIRILDGCGFSPDIGIRVLVDKCLLNVSMDNALWMHDLLQEMGQQIVKRESPEEPGERSRLWEKTDVLHMLAKKTGTKMVEGIILEEGEQLNVNVNAKAFLNLTKLRLLKVHNVQLLEGLEYLSDELSLLDWHGYSSKSLPSSLRLDKAVVIQLQCSHIEQLWKEVQPLNRLKVINLSHSKMFKKTPDFKDIPNLEELILEGCTRLCEIHPSLLVHKKLMLLNMEDCTSLTTLPSEICMGSLKKLKLSGCLKLKKFPEVLGSMECLTELFLDRTVIKELPSSIDFFTGLILLSLKDCKNLVGLPSTINGLKSLITLKLSGCPKLEYLPENFGQIESLEELDIRGTTTREPLSNSWYSRFPLSFMAGKSSGLMILKLPPLSGLISLKKLNLSYRNVEVIPCDIGNLVSLEKLYLMGNNFVSLPASINRLSKLRFLSLKSCKRLQSVPELPANVKHVVVNNCMSLETLSVNALNQHPFRIMACRNCSKLLNYDGVSSIFSALKKELEPEPEPEPKLGPRVRYKEISVCIPGSEIPKWFRFQSEGSSIKIKGDRELKLKGYALCALFFVHKLHPSFLDSSFHLLRCNISLWGINYKSYLRDGLADHLWLKYIPVYGISKPGDWYDFELKFVPSNAGLEVRRCGAHPLYEEEVEELCSSYVSGNLIELFHQDSVTTTKHNLIGYDGVDQSESVKL